jgi:hypothetical protein
MSSAPAERYPPRKRISRRHVRLGAQEGQSLIIVVTAMFVVIAFAAFAIDVSTWYQKHHQVQVAADAAALAAANCMTNGGSCNFSTSAAASTATSIAAANQVGLTSASQVTINTTANNVTVTTAAVAPVTFAGRFGLHPSVSAVAVASWQASNAKLSLFAANATCGSGLGLDFLANGGGNQDISGIFSNGQFNINSNSNHPVDGAFADDHSGSGCSGNTTSVKDGTISDAGTNAVPYPMTYAQPTGAACTYSASYFTTSTTIGTGGNATTVPTTNLITSPGVYCVTSSFNGSSCSDDFQDSTKTGWIYADGTSLTGGYEFVAPCVTITNPSSALTGPSGGPLVYGTSNITTAAPTPSGLPTCADTSNNSDTTNIDTNGADVGGTIYDQCGTAELWGNNDFTGFVEAANIKVEKNNNVTGTGPTAPYELGTDILTQ